MNARTLALAAAGTLVLGAGALYVARPAPDAEAPRAALAPNTTPPRGYVSPEHEMLDRRLHAEGLILHPEVYDSVQAFAERTQRAEGAGETARIEETARLSNWLEQWIAADPARADSVRAEHRARTAPPSAPS